MSIPSKATIDNLPPSVSERYAVDELIKTSPGFYQQISSISPQTRPQIAVFEPLESSQLESLTGALGKAHTLAYYAMPRGEYSSDIFSFGVFPTLLEKDKELIMNKLDSLANSTNADDVGKIKSAVHMLSDLNQMGLDTFARARQLKQG